MTVEAVGLLILGAIFAGGARLLWHKVDQVLTAVVTLNEQVTGARGLVRRVDELGERSHKHATMLTDHEGRITFLERDREKP